MATVTASRFVSHVHGGATSVESRSNLAQIGLRNQIVTHNGLRSMNTVDMLQLKTNTKVTSKQSRSMVKKPNADGLSGTIICGTGMNLVFVAAEVGPWSKTGGLGDVLGGLPPAMAANGHRVMTVSPRYDQYKDAWDTSVLVEIEVGGRIEIVRLFHCYKRGVDCVFVDHPMFLEKVLGKTGSKIYGPNAGTDYKDNQLRFGLLCQVQGHDHFSGFRFQAALMVPRVLNLNSNKYFSGPYGEDVIFIASDWHTALLPCYLKTMFQSRGIYMKAKVAFCIHNIAY